MKILKSMLLVACVTMTVDLNSKAVSFSVRNLSGAPIVGGVWKWLDGTPADIQGITPINSGELPFEKGWMWDDKNGPINKVSLIREEKTDPGNSAIRESKTERFTTELIRYGNFPNSWDFALLPGGRIIPLRNYVGNYDTTGRYLHPNFDTLYQGRVSRVETPYVVMADGKTHFGNVKQIVQPTATTAGKVVLDDGREYQGIVKLIVTGKVVFTDGTVVLGDGTVTR